MIDPNIRPGFIRDAQVFRARLDRLLAVADVVKLSDVDIDWLGMTPDEVLDAGARILCLTEGAAGVRAITREAEVRVPAHRVEVVDTGIGIRADRLESMRASSPGCIVRVFWASRPRRTATCAPRWNWASPPPRLPCLGPGPTRPGHRNCEAAPMKAIVQRVTEARVDIAGDTVGRIGPGVLVLVCAMQGDAEPNAKALAERVAKLRIFRDDNGRMNRSLLETGGGALVVSQFTLAADTSRGNRPGFSAAAPPDEGERLYEHFVSALRATGIHVETGRFGADMAVYLVNDGPVTVPMER